MTRGLLENATGVATGSVYREGGFWNEQARAFAGRCGASGDCRHVHTPTASEAMVIKSHYPFLGQPDAAFNNECVSAILMTVRHPLDNYVAWMTFIARETKGQPLSGDKDVTKMRDEFSFAAFVKLWQQHLTYWQAYAVRHSIPLLAVRYEDVCGDPRSSMRRVLDFLSVFKGADFMRVPAASPFGQDCVLRNVRKFPEAAALVTQDELGKALGGMRNYLPDVFGYERHIDVARDFYAAARAGA
ncbi:MAG: sulfotransferase domain-containing protein [Rhodoferax sp.]|nr:sulfotransferase domain-containing protein [Rhodoferax sp.]